MFRDVYNNRNFKSAVRAVLANVVLPDKCRPTSCIRSLLDGKISDAPRFGPTRVSYSALECHSIILTTTHSPAPTAWANLSRRARNDFRATLWISSALYQMCLFIVIKMPTNDNISINIYKHMRMYVLRI